MIHSWFLQTFILAYLLGSIPFGLILTRLAGLNDIRKIGSGNIGATNVMRTGNKGLGVLTLLLDGGKGFAAVSLTRYFFNNDYAVYAAFFAVIGHIFPVWLRFKGGKGVATTIGGIFAIDWVLALCICFIWVLAFFFLRISSVSSLLSIVYSTIVAYLIAANSTMMLCLVLAALIVFTHRQNIRRILSGTEHHFSEKKP